MGNLLLFIGFAALIAFWLDGMSVRERAVRAARNACQRNESLLLDQTVALEHLRLRRDSAGRMRFQRSYSFEFLSDDGEVRRSGSILLLGRRIENLTLELPSHTLYDLD
ncbi:MAG: DUF3301 domain-containing protein [Gammaproteobacteria bacterium]|nr:DUF3301 domain-containing protein [Gammaproteobacteria bacterium]